MRIISGVARGRSLAAPAGRSTRPTSDRVREALFSMLFSRLGSFEGARVLDLFSGTGALALEALSRGAREALLIDRDRRAAEAIAANISACGMEERAELIRGDVLKTLPRMATGETFDLIFLDPPYGQDLASEVLSVLGQRRLLSPDGLICIETAQTDRLPDQVGPLRRTERRSYGSTAIHLFQYREPEASES